MSLAGSVAVVTGAGRGIGRAVALALGAKRARVVVSDVDERTAAGTVEEIRAQGGVASAVPADVANTDQVDRLFRDAVRVFGDLDILVNNAGIAVVKPLVEYTEDDWDRQMAVNVTGVFLCTQAAARIMIPKRRGRIVHVASISAYAASRTPEVVYDTSKGAVRQFTVSAAAELAPFGITVNAVAPGTTRTDLNASSLVTEEQVSRAVARIPLGRIARPEEIAGPIVFLCSPEAGYVTGHVLVVDGGQLLY